MPASGGDQLSLNVTNTRIMNKAYSTESDNWLGHVIELLLGTYTYKDETNETVVVRPISLREAAGTEVATRVIPPASPPRDSMDCVTAAIARNSQIDFQTRSSPASQAAARAA